MRATSYERRTRPIDGAVMSAGFLRFLLAENPEASDVAVTRRLTDGAIVGVNVGETSCGRQSRCPWTGRAVGWLDLAGGPHWNSEGLQDSEVYRSEIVSRADFVQEIG